jgi:hypothetical protein
MAPPMAAPVPGGGGGGGIEMLASTNHFTIQQKKELLEAVSMGCIEQPNSYTIFDATSGRPLMIAQEKSDMIPRICCKPQHSLLVHFYAVDGAGNKAAPIMTLERPGCLGAKPCVGRGPCGPCLDEMKLHQGYVEGDVGDIPEQMVMGSAKVPSMAGGFTPSLEIFDKGNESLGMFEATGTCPCLFGGMSEMCCDQNYSINGPSGEVGKIVKKKPGDLMSAVTELMSDADTFTLELNANMTPEQKASMIGSLLLLDYMFFERDSDGWSFDPIEQKVTINLFNCYCYGCIHPCTCTCGGGSGEGGE